MTGNIDGFDGTLLEKLKEIENELKPYEEEEQKMWEEYASDVDDALDSDELFKEYQLRVSDSDSIITQKDLDSLNLLDRLLHLRHKKNRLLNVILASATSNYVSSPELSHDERFWAVIVGINNYDDEATGNLCGCVSDALLMYDYLTVDLRVPQSHISLLLSPALSDPEMSFKYEIPKRDKILDALYGLRNRNDIQTEDNIVLFFAGHGTSYKHPEYNIEAICPMDRNTSRLKSDGDVVLDISDREINVILGEIAKKTSNITVILDCCFNYQWKERGEDMAGTVSPPIDIRSCSPVHLVDSVIHRMFEAADTDTRRSTDRPLTSDPNFHANMQSHVLMAASKDFEFAREYKVSDEVESQGCFTTALISALRSPLGRDRATSYRSLIGSQELAMRYQTAFVAGQRKRDALWFRPGPC